MKRIVLILIIFVSFSNAQDTLTTNLDALYTGQLIEIGDTYIRFFHNGNTSRVPYRMIKKIVLENGSVAFEDGRAYIHSFKVDKASMEFGTGQTLGDSLIVDFSEKSLKIRSVIALEKIATAQTFFMYFAIITTVLSLIAIGSM